MKDVLLVGLGSALGGMARYGIATGFAVRFGVGFPVGTLFANITGSFLIGLMFAVLIPGGGRWPSGESGRFFLMTGLMGGYTTFSTFGLETANFLRAGDARTATVYALVSVVGCVAAALTGIFLGGILNR
ncbi:MAG: CrcB family protein [Verrucomicrobiae bacterium]|nr:CrcB family protein [Verrucomicrobiae bacterium]